MTKFLAMAAAMLALIVTPAQAQKRPHQGESEKKQEQKPQVDEKAYKAALEKIPEPKEKYDPWGAARPPEPAKRK